MKKYNLSVKDIADLSGTSVATVSRVINQNGRFSKETESRVRKVIEEYGYQPNQNARSLRTKKTDTIGILVPDLSLEFYARITKEVQMKLNELGYLALICNTYEKKEETEKYLHMFRNQKISGIVYIGNNDILYDTDLPVVFIDQDPRHREELQQGIGKKSYCLIECDNIQGGYLAGRELVKKGVKKPVYVGHESRTISTYRKRLMGFEQAFAEADIPISENQIFDASIVWMDTGARIMEQAMKEIPDLDGVFFGSDTLAIGALCYLNREGIRVPEQVRVIGFDDISFTDIMSITTVRQPMAEMGRLAAVRIVDMIHGNEIKEQRQRLQVELIVRGST